MSDSEQSDGSAADAQATQSAKKPVETSRKGSNAQTASGNDHFVLEKIYKEAHSVFAPTDVVDPKSAEALVALDTNVLLLPYLLENGDLSALAVVYKALAGEGRLYIPQRVAREFIKNRDRKLADMARAIEDRISKINDQEANVTPLLLDDFPQKEALLGEGQALSDAAKKYASSLRKLAKHIRSWRGTDPATTLYNEVFKEGNVIGTSESEERILKELRYSIVNQVPPGYKDKKKDDQGIGDVVIWMSLLELGRTTKKDLIFVTGEQKADWFVRSGQQPIYPRPELIDAYRIASGGRSLRLSSLHDLLREMAAPPALITDVEAAEKSANNAIQAASSVQLEDMLPSDGSLSRGYFTVSPDQLSEIDDASDTWKLVTELAALKEELTAIQASISKMTNDDVNTSLSLPWNRASYALRVHHQGLRKRIHDLEMEIRARS